MLLSAPNAAVQRRPAAGCSARRAHNEMTHTRCAAMRVGPSAATGCYTPRDTPLQFLRNHSICSSVSGTVTPRAFDTIANTSRGSWPKDTSTAAAAIPERPIPARQCTATPRPARTSPASRLVNVWNSRVARGTPRSAMGKLRNVSPTFSATERSAVSSSSDSSRGSSNEAIVVTPIWLKPRSSSRSHSPDRGRAMTARKPPSCASTL